MARAEWAVEAAEQMLPVVKIIWGACNTIEGEMALEKARWLYRDLLTAVGTIPGDRTDEVADATIRGATVTEALDAVGA